VKSRGIAKVAATFWRIREVYARYSRRPSLEVLGEGGKVFCGFTGVSEEHAASENDLSIDDWRGGLAFIGDIEAAT
jgi:hypothetical protein